MAGRELDAVKPLHAAAELIAEGEGWLVGGAVRDALLGRAHPDYDLAIVGPAEAPARAIARAAGGYAFSLSDAFGAWRVAARERNWQLDLTPLTGSSLEQDLKRRDLTINAIAQPLKPGISPGVGQLIDPWGGVADLGTRTLRAVSASAFRSDPLRVMRLARLAVELGEGFNADQETLRLARRAARQLTAVAPERVFAELSRTLCADGAPAGIELLFSLDALAVVLPELVALRGVGQSAYHDRDVFGHTLAALEQLIELERARFELLGEDGARLASPLGAPFANDLSRGQALRWAVLLHDIAKPQTRSETSEGRVSFIGHDLVGAEVGGEIIRRLRASERLSRYVSRMTEHHLRLGFLVHQQPLSRREVYRYLTACDPVALDVTILSVADRLATRGRNSEAAIEAHLRLARELIGSALDFEQWPPQAPIAGDRLAAALAIKPGPVLGPLLAELTEAAYVGEIVSDDEDGVVRYARALLAQAPPDQLRAGIR